MHALSAVHLDAFFVQGPSRHTICASASPPNKRFVVKQLTENALEYRAKQFFIFIDLRKTYNFVSQEAL